MYTVMLVYFADKVRLLNISLYQLKKLYISQLTNWVILSSFPHMRCTLLKVILWFLIQSNVKFLPHLAKKKLIIEFFN